MIDKKNLIHHELIGLTAKVSNSHNEADIGMFGKVIDETRDTLVIRNGVPKRIFKKNVRIEFELPNKSKATVDGEKLVGRPWDRIKK